MGFHVTELMLRMSEYESMAYQNVNGLHKSKYINIVFVGCWTVGKI